LFELPTWKGKELPDYPILRCGLSRIAELFEMPFESAQPVVMRGVLVHPEKLFSEAMLQQTIRSAPQRVGLFRGQTWLNPRDNPEAYGTDGLQQLRQAAGTLILRGIQQQPGPLRDLCMSIMAGGNWAAVHAKVLETPPGEQGFGVHYDPDGSLAMQLRNRKTWWVFPPVVRSFAEFVATFIDRDYGSGFSDAERDGFRKELARFTFTLAPGDMCYVPPGWEHFCEGGGAASSQCDIEDRSLHAVIGSLPRELHALFGNEDHQF
jgi:hypothetical protein